MQEIYTCYIMPKRLLIIRVHTYDEFNSSSAASLALTVGQRLYVLNSDSILVLGTKSLQHLFLKLKCVRMRMMVSRITVLILLRGFVLMLVT